MTHGLARRYGSGDLHFITCSCYRRLPLLGSAQARDHFVHTLAEMRARFGFLLVGYVITPEHVHLLIGETAVITPSDIMRELKRCVSVEIGGVRPVSIAPSRTPQLGSEESLRTFWQRRFYDFNVRSLRKKNEKLHYMHMNPVKRGLVRNPKDWIWSSYCFYMRIGKPLVGVDRVDESNRAMQTPTVTR